MPVGNGSKSSIFFNGKNNKEDRHVKIIYRPDARKKNTPTSRYAHKPWPRALLKKNSEIYQKEIERKMIGSPK